MRNVRKQFTTTVRKADGDRRLRFVISDGGADREGDTINPQGWVLDNYKANPVVLWAHDHSALPIAKAVEIGVTGDGLAALAEFAKHEFASEVYELYSDGFLSAVSVGFRPIDWENNGDGIDFLKQELLEFSAVPVPANPRALIAAQAANSPQLRKWARNVLARDTAGKITAGIIGGMRRAADRRNPRGTVLEIDRGGVALEIEPTINLSPSQVAQATRRGVARAVSEFVKEQVDAAVEYQRGKVR